MAATIDEVLSQPHGKLDQRLLEVAEARMLSPARRAGVALRPVGVTGPPRTELVETSAWGSWLFTDHLSDPTAAAYRGRIPIPRVQHQTLVRYLSQGVNPHLIWMGHQVPKGWSLGDPLPVPAPRALRERDARLTRWLEDAWRTYLRGAGAVLGAALAPPAALGAGLDPVILGGVQSPAGDRVLWVVLAQWTWE